MSKIWRNDIVKWFFNEKNILITAYFVITRIILIFIGIIAHKVLNPNSYKNIYDFFFIWDSGAYIDIAKNGYLNNSLNIGFFPFYPILIKICQFVLYDYKLAAIVVSNVNAFISTIMLVKLYDYDRIEKKKNNSFVVAKYLLFFPASFLLSAIFSESTLLLLILLSFYNARKKKWLLSSIFASLAVLTKSMGVWLIIPLLYEYINQCKFNIKKIKLDILFLILIPLTLFVFMLWQYFNFGDPLAFSSIQQTYWGHEITNPLSVILKPFTNNDLRGKINAIVTIISFFIFLFNFKRIRKSYLIFSLLFLILPLMSGGYAIGSMIRYIIPIFPIYFILSKIPYLFNSKYAKYNEEIILTCLFGLNCALCIFWTLGFLLV